MRTGKEVFESASYGPGNHKTNINAKSIIIVMKHILIAGLLSISMIAGVHTLRAATDDAPVVAKPASTKVAKQMPFYGTVKAVDKTARTLTLAGKEKDRVFRVEDTTKIHDAGEARTLDDVKVGRRVGGLAKANAEGQWVIATLNLGVKQTRTPAEDEAEQSANPTE
jgi:hypothetical protein